MGWIMKKYFTLILSFIILILSFVNGWFLDQIVDRSIFWGFVPSVLLGVLFIICFIDAIKDLKEFGSRFAAIALVILFININMLIFIPFREIRVEVDFKIFKDERTYLVDKISDWTILPDEDGNININEMYSGISSNRTLRVYEHSDDDIVIGFYVSEKMPFKTALLIYTQSSEEKIKEVFKAKELDIRKIDNNWYFIQYDK